MNTLFHFTDRPFFRAMLPLALFIATLGLLQCQGGKDTAVFIQEPLPYARDALAPVISGDTMDLHYGKHYAGYVAKANALVKGGRYAGVPPEAVIQAAAGVPSQSALFNHAAQAWNHAFFFKCMKPDGGGEPEGILAEMMASAFGSVADFKKAFVAAAGDQFGSGWVWLVLDDGKLAVIKTGNADTPIAHGQTPLFTVDVWEHAYYLDYQNRRTDFVKALLDKLANWDFVAAQLERALPATAS